MSTAKSVFTNTALMPLLLCAALGGGCNEGSTPVTPSPDGGGATTDSGATPSTDAGSTGNADGGAGEGGADSGGPMIQSCARDEDCTRGPACTVGRCANDRTCSYAPDNTRCECDRDCHTTSASRAMGWDDPGRRGVEYDVDSDGLIVRAESRRGDFLWVPNSAESTFSKWDANTGMEIAKYRVGVPSGGANNSPSRVVVDGNGDAFVATRGIGVVGTVTKVAADLRDCVDRNMNGVIDTSMSRTDVRPYGQDECVLWSTEVGPANGLLRALAIGPATEDEPGGSVWAGVCGNATGQWRLHSTTGRIVRSFSIPRCTYGAVATRDGNIWFHTPSGGVTPINSVSNAVGEYADIAQAPAECRSSYGITADANGRIWLSRAGNGVAGYDPATRQWTCMQSTGVTGGRAGALGSGITVDPMNRVWAPQAGSPLLFYVWDAAAFVAGGTIPPAAIRTYSLGREFGSSALGADRSGRMWVVQGSELVRFDPASGAQTTLPGPVGVYTYTDFTGAVRRLILREGSYTQDYERCENGRFTTLTWSGETPGTARMVFVARTASTAAGLATATPVTIAMAPGSMSPLNIEAALTGAGEIPQRFLRITVRFVPGMATPVLRSLAVEHRCVPMGVG
jgi:hypothetical protein